MNEDTPPESSAALLQRANLLMDQGRFEDAALWFQKLLMLEPNSAHHLSQLAICWAQDPEKREQCKTAAKQALALEPDVSHFHAVMSLVLIESAKVGQDAQIKEGLASAEKAIKLDPDNAYAHALQGLALLRLQKYRAAEEAARRSLSLNTNSTLATQVLSMSLLNQKKDDDLKSLVDWQLNENPEDDAAHVSAGYQCLSQGRHREACDHFREALRINPTSETARSGLVHSFRARSFVYRLYIRFCHFMGQFGPGGARGIMFAGFLIYRFLFATLRHSYPAVAYTLAGVWMVFALWTWLARGIGSALMLTDRFVRMAITPKEKWEGFCVGGMLLLAASTLIVGLATNESRFVLTALACFLGCIPVATAFHNEHHIGRWLDFIAGSISGGASVLLVVLLMLGMEGPFWPVLFPLALYTGVAMSWLRMFGVLYR